MQKGGPSSAYSYTFISLMALLLALAVFFGPARPKRRSRGDSRRFREPFEILAEQRCRTLG